MNQHERQSYWTMIAILLVSNAVLLLAIWFVGIEQRHQCERDGVVVLAGESFNCEVQ